jgi:hypothetical protein
LRLLHRQYDEIVVGRVDRINLRESSSIGSFLPLIGKRTRAPSWLNASTSAGRQTIVIR